MLSRPDSSNFITTIEFELINVQQQSYFEPIRTEIEKLAPAIAYNFCQSFHNAPQEFFIQFHRTAGKHVASCRFFIRLPTKHDVSERFTEDDDPTDLMKEVLNKGIILACVEKSIMQVDPLRRLNFKPSISVKISSVACENQNTKFNGKINRKKYDYNASGNIELVTFEFIDESQNLLVHNSDKQTFLYDFLDRLIEIAYEYKNYVLPDKSQLDLLKNEASAYVEKHPKCAPFLQSINQNEFNQALRRACTTGNVDLVVMLFKYDEKIFLDLDLNQSAVSSNKTPLDYAIASGCEELVNLLRLNGAKCFAEMYLSFVDTERDKVNALNAQNKTKSRHNTMGFSNNFSSPFGDSFENSTAELVRNIEKNRLLAEKKEKEEERAEDEKAARERAAHFENIQRHNREPQQRVERFGNFGTHSGNFFGETLFPFNPSNYPANMHLHGVNSTTRDISNNAHKPNVDPFKDSYRK